MKAVKVEYQVKLDFVEQNKTNIERVMKALQKKNISSMFYSSYYLGEGKFIHHNITTSIDFSQLSIVDEFKEFQDALKASDPIVKPISTDLEVIGFSKEVL